MISLKGLLSILSLPVRLLWVTIKYPFVGGANAKFKNSLVNSLKIELCRFALTLPVHDTAAIANRTTQGVIDKLKPLYPTRTNLNNYGKKFDKQSIWLVEVKGRSHTDPIVIYLHGGGYFINTSPSQITSVLSMYHLLDEEKRKRTSILVLDYSLACHGHYIGTQLYELAATYNKLVSEGNDNFVLMGDSAGGNLAITFLQYLKQEKNPKLPWPRSEVLISPWVKLAGDKHQFTPGHSYHDNEKHDMLSSNFAKDPKRQAHLLGGKSPADLLISPGNVPYKTSDWNDIPTLNSKGYSTFVILGEHEVFRDDILEWSKYALGSPLVPQSQESKGKFDSKAHEYKSGGINDAYIDVVVEPWGIHDSVLFFENRVMEKLEKQHHLKLNDLDDEELFGIVKITKFLNKTLVVK
ncbi:hypothetical protein CANMA_002653 [Candida margitis]|uniref:uncharacterized protein n=1 Tax=Candida margitis TaxID=1775924 RepID=UPI0022262320|nr:uncharacterized protein CANMA_002653 [Candida margitis]KAI5967885.1 hypothetical protein CANMA_002653 [Candida margitis]